MYRRSFMSFGLTAVALVLTACPSGTVTPSPGAPAKVSSGSNVTAQLAGDTATGTKSIKVTFASVSGEGEVAVKSTTAGPSLPAGLTLTTGAFFDVTTTAKFDKATLCFDNDKVTSNSKLLHFTDDKWNDRTTTVTPPTICGDFSSFSPVAIVEGTLATATPTPSASPTPTPAATATATPTAATTATATAAPTATAAQTTVPAESPTTAPTQAPTAAPTTAPPTPVQTATPTPTQAVVPNAPPCPTTGLAICGTVTDAATGQPIAKACITLGPPIRCFTTTGGDGRYVINLTELAAPSGSTWDMYILRNTPEPKYAQVYSDKFVVSGVVTKNFALNKL